MIGAKDVAETTQCILRSLMTNAVAECMTFAGCSSTSGISDLKILDVTICRYTTLHLLFVQLLPRKLIHNVHTLCTCIMSTLWISFLGSNWTNKFKTKKFRCCRDDVHSGMISRSCCASHNYTRIGLHIFCKPMASHLSTDEKRPYIAQAVSVSE